MIKVKLGEIYASTEALKHLNTIKFPSNISWKLATLTRHLNPELEQFESKRLELVKELGTEQEDGTIKVMGDNLKPFSEKINEISAIEVDLNFEKIKVADLGETAIEPQYLLGFVFE